jgi:catechol 2,3-dioxygenase-like lactoylglutathione lyase family enzyme
VQVAIPEGGEESAREFYGALLGMAEIEKPPELARRGGCWFRLGALEIHCGVEADFRPARKAHPGIEVNDLATLAGALEGAGVEVTRDALFPRRERFYVNDPFGNRLEFIGPAEGSSA